MAQNTKQDERRILSRFELRARSILKRLQDGEEILELFTRDVSSKGAFFLTRSPLPIETTLAITLFLPIGQATSRLSIAGKVVRAEDEGMAVQFDPGYTLAPA